MKWLLSTTALAAVLCAGPVMAGGKTGSHNASVGDSNSTEASSASITTGQVSGVSAWAKVDSYGKSVAGKNKASSYINAWSRAHTDDTKTDGKKIDSHASVDIHDKAYARAKNGEYYAASSATAAATGRDSKNGKVTKKATESVGASASAEGGPHPSASASAHTGKEHVTAKGEAGVGVSASGSGKQVIVHRNGETIIVEYTPHTEAVAVEDKKHAEAYAAVAAHGQVFNGKTLIAAATAAAYAFAEGWLHGAYAAAESSGKAYAKAGPGWSTASAAGQAEAVVYLKGHLIKIVLPAVPKIIVRQGLSPLLVGDPPAASWGPNVSFCETRHDASGWHVACRTEAR